MIFTAFTILLLAAVFSGVGFLVQRILFRSAGEGASLQSFMQAFWIGWALVIGVLQLWHLAYRVDWLALGLVVIAGAAGWALYGWKAARLAIRARPVAALGMGALAVATALVLGNHVLFNQPNSDHGLYHMQTIAWISSYAIVPGLGNLHHRLAFNNASFLYDALVNAGPLAGRGYYLANTLPALMLILYCAGGVYRLFNSQGAMKKSDLYAALMLVLVVQHVSSADLAGFSPDFPVFALQVLLGGALLRLTELPLDQGKGAFMRQAAYILLLTAVGMAIKLSFVAFGGLVILALIIIYVVRLGLKERGDALRLLAGAGIIAAFVAPWMIRSVILSGYLAFPNTLVAFDVPWRMPDSMSLPVANVITEWARTCSDSFTDTHDLRWFIEWSGCQPFLIRQVSIISLALIVLGLAASFVARKRVAVDWISILLLGVGVGAVLFWFLMGPTYRFAGASFWIVLVAALMLWLHLADGLGLAKPLFSAAALMLVLAILISPNHFSNNLSKSRFLLPPLEMDQLKLTWPVRSAQPKMTDEGQTVYTAQDGLCWDSPLPCTPLNDFVPTLRLIVPGHIEKGFKYVKQH